MSNLRFISEHSASSVSEFSVTDIFTSDFSIYKIVVTDIDQSSSGGSHNNISFLSSSGDVILGANYDYARQQLRAYGSALEDSAVNQSKFRLLGQTTGNSAVGATGVMYIIKPTDDTCYTFAFGQNSGYYESAGALGGKGIALHKEFASVTGLKFYPQNSGTTYDNIAFKVYGLAIDT